MFTYWKKTIIHIKIKIKNVRKSPNCRININLLLWQVSAHLLNSGMSRIRISPCGSGSDFYNMITDPLIRIRITGFALWLSCWRQSHHIGKYFQRLKKPIKSSKLKKALVFKTTRWLFFFFLWTYCLELLKLVIWASYTVGTLYLCIPVYW